MGPLAIPLNAIMALHKAAGLRRRRMHSAADFCEAMARLWIRRANPEWWPA